MSLFGNIKNAFSSKRVPRASWQAGKSGNRVFRNFGNPGPNKANEGFLNVARGRARDAARNAPFARRAIELMVTNIVGAGIVPRFDDRAIQALWTTWEDECDADDMRDIYGLQESAVRAWWEGGEAFIRIRPRRPEDGLVVPLQLNLLEADMLPLFDQTLSDGNKIVQGVEFNLIGKRVAYWFHKTHPGDEHGYGVSLDSLTRVPAEYVIHLFEVLRPGQVRGFPQLATALQRIQQLSDYDEATIERQKLAASLTLIITRPEATSPGVDPITGDEMEGRSVSDIAPGSAYQLYPGEDIKAPSLPSLGGEYEAFNRVQHRAVAASVGLPYELLTGDFAGMSDRTARVIINEYRRRVEQHQWHRVVRQMMRVVHREFITAGKLSGAIALNASPAVRWVTPAWPYFHPVQDVDSMQKEIDAGLRSRQDAIYSRGNDPETVLAERVEDLRNEAATDLTSSTVNKE